MQCAARSAPHQRSLPARRASTSFEPTPSVDAASSRRSSSAKRPAKPPNEPIAPAVAVLETAARSRSTTPSAVASETPAPAYVRSFAHRSPAIGRVYEVRPAELAR